MSMMRMVVLVVLLAASWPGVALADVPKTVVTIRPLHSLVSGVMNGVGTPYLVIKNAGSPHSHALKPSDAKALTDAKVVFWMGKELERFLERPLKALAGGAKIVWMIDAPGLMRLAYREGGLFAGDKDEHGHEGHDHGSIDMHFWLNPKNAASMVSYIAQNLTEADPGNAASYAANAKLLIARLDRLDGELEKTLAPVKGKPYVVFHDSYQYLEKRYGISALGSISANPELPPGAAHLKALRAAMKKRGAQCVFSEPQFDQRRVKALVSGMAVRTGSLDPLGSSLEAGPELYFGLMRSLAKSLSTCLSGAG